MKNLPTVSVCIPVFNGERYLSQAIESVLTQTYEDFELIISDNDSTDTTGEIARGYAAKDKRIVYWKNEHNIGLSQNYNVSFSKATGTYIKPFAHDDLLEPTFLEKMVAVLDKHPDVALVGCARKIVDTDGNIIGQHIQFPEDRLIPGRDVIRYNLLRLTNWVGEPVGVMFRRELVGEGFDPFYYLYCEIEFYFRLLENSNFYFLNETLCGFRVHPGSASSRNHSGILFALDMFRLGKKYRSYLEEVGETEEMFSKRAVESIALNVDHLCRTEDLTYEKFLETGSPRGTGDAAHQEALKQLEGFKEVGFHSVRYVTELLAQLHDLQCRFEIEQERHNTELANLRNSTSWKITAPLRKLPGRMKTSL